MGRPFEQKTVINDSGVEEEEVTREDQLTQDLVQAWEVTMDKYLRREAEHRALPTDIVHVELVVNKAVYYLIEVLLRLLA